MKNIFTLIIIAMIFLLLGCANTTTPTETKQHTTIIDPTPIIEEVYEKPTVEEVEEPDYPQEVGSSEEGLITCSNGWTYNESDEPWDFHQITPKNGDERHHFSVELYDDRKMTFSVPQNTPSYYLYYRKDDRSESMTLSLAEDARCLEVGDSFGPTFTTWEKDGNGYSDILKARALTHPAKGEAPVPVDIGAYSWVEIITDYLGKGQIQSYFADVNSTPENSNDDLQFGMIGYEGCGLTITNTVIDEELCDQDEFAYSVLKSLSIKDK